MSSSENERDHRPRHFKDDEPDIEPAEDMDGEPDGAAEQDGDTERSAEAESAEAETPAEEKTEEKKDGKKKNAREPETSFDYVVPAQSFSSSLRHPELSSIHRGKTKTATREQIEEAEEGFLFHMPSSKKRRHHRHHHHHHHHSSHSSHSSGSGSSGSSSGSSGSSGSSSHSSSHSSGSSSHSSSHGSGSSSRGSSHGSGSSGHHHHHHHRHRRRPMPLWLKIIIISLCVIIGLAGALAGTYAILREIGRSNMHNYDNIVIVPPTEAGGEEVITVVDDGETVVYDGVTYRFNKNVVCVNFIGVDHDIENKSVQSMGDSINIVACDTETGKLTVIGVSRDTMTDVNLYSDEGNYIDTERMQLAYAYSFGNNVVTGGENTSKALSKLFYGLPLNKYFAINMEALVTINDAIGGVTLRSSVSFVSPIDGRFIDVGDMVTLHGREVQFYVADRETEVLDSNNSRMERQQEYIRAFLSQAIPAAKNDLAMITNLYDIIKVNSDTNLALPEITYLASTAVTKLGSLDDIEFLRLKGEIKEGEHAELYTDDKDVLEKMLKVFYTPVQ